MRSLLPGVFLIVIGTTAALAAPFKVSSPKAASGPKLKIETEYKEGGAKGKLTLPKVEIKTPLAPGLDLAIKASYRAIREEGRFGRSGPGDLEVKSKWNFLSLGDFAMAIEPLVSFPTGSARRGLGEGDVAFELPLILGYKTGAWELGAEIGYTHTHHQREDDIAYLGMLVMRRVLPTLRLGTEIVMETPRARLREADTFLNVGLKWGFGGRFELQALAGTSLDTADHQRVGKFKLAIETKF